MLKYHADVDLRDFEGNTPLHYACWNGSVDICAALLKAGATVDVQDQAGRTPLYYSVQHKHPDIVQFLLENHSDPTIQTCTGVTPESLANQENIIGIVEIFQKFNKEINEQNQKNGNGEDSNGNGDSSDNLLGKDFTEEHNRMKVAISKLIEGRNKEWDMLQILQGSLDEHNSAMCAVQNNMKDTMNQLRTIEQVLKGIMSLVSSIPDMTSSPALESNSSFDYTNQNRSQIAASTNGSILLQKTGPALSFTGINSSSGSSIGLNNSNVNAGISPLLPAQNDQKRKDKMQSKTHNEPNKSMPPLPLTLCIMCKTNPATMRCKNCRSPFCNKCIQKVRQTGVCPICNSSATKADKS